MQTSSSVEPAVTALRNGGVIAYPTEAVYGLGCDPFNEAAVIKLFSIKKRNPQKGLILVASHFNQIESLILPIEPSLLTHALSTWPGPVTWVFPASNITPSWIKGTHSTIALRISDHPVIQELCTQFNGPIVSTSANLEGQPPERNYESVRLLFENQIDFILNGALGALSNPTTIRDVMTGRILR